MKTKKMRKIAGLMMFFLLTLSLPQCFAEGNRNYLQNLAYDYVRGVKNIVSSPAEIVRGIRDYPDTGEAGWIRGTRGFFDGNFKMINRIVSGGWDFCAALIPGYQEGIPPTPETLF